MKRTNARHSARSGFILAAILLKASLMWGLSAAVLVPMIAMRGASNPLSAPVAAGDDVVRIAHIQALRAAIDAYTAENLTLPDAVLLATLAPTAIAPAKGAWYCYGMVADSGEFFVAGWLPGTGKPEISGNFASDGSSTVARAILARSTALQFEVPGRCPAVPGYVISEVGKG